MTEFAPWSHRAAETTASSSPPDRSACSYCTTISRIGKRGQAEGEAETIYSDS